MADIQKPSDINKIWGSSGDVISPTDTKIANGWVVEIPPRQWFNWLDNKQDQSIAHINQHGIPVWDSVTEYQANKSYVQGSDGIVYKALQTHVNQDPTTATLYWIRAFVPYNFLPKRTFGVSDYIRIPDVAGGLIFQWTQATVTVGSGSITFPIPFPNGVLHTYVSSRSNAAVFATVNSQSSTGCFINLWTDAGNPPLVAQTFDIFVVGY